TREAPAMAAAARLAGIPECAATDRRNAKCHSFKFRVFDADPLPALKDTPPPPNAPAGHGVLPSLPMSGRPHAGAPRQTHHPPPGRPSGGAPTEPVVLRWAWGPSPKISEPQRRRDAEEPEPFSAPLRLCGDASSTDLRWAWGPSLAFELQPRSHERIP